MFIKSFIASALLLFGGMAHAERTVMEGKVSTNQSILVSSNSTNVSIATGTTYPNAPFYVNGNAVINGQVSASGGFNGLAISSVNTNTSLYGYGTLTSTMGVNASSVSVLNASGFVLNSQIDSSSVTKQGPISYSSLGNIPQANVNLSTVTTQFNSVGTSTASLQTQIAAINVDTTSVATSTTNLNNVKASTGVCALPLVVYQLNSSSVTCIQPSNVTGNAATVTTNASLTGPVTSVGNATTIAGPVPVATIDLSTVTSQFITDTTSMTNTSTGGFLASSSMTAHAFFGDGSNLTGIPSTNSISGAYMPIAGGTSNIGFVFTDNTVANSSFTIFGSSVISQILFKNNGGAAAYINQTGGTGTNSRLAIGNGAAANQVVFNNGLIGISTGSPQAGLDVEGVQNVILNAGYTLLPGTMTIQGNAFSVGGSTFVVSAGSVGIGVSSPKFLLDMASTGVGVDAGLNVKGGRPWSFLSRGNGFPNFNSGLSIGDFTNNTNGAINISFDYNVGLSTPTPTQPLVVHMGANQNLGFGSTQTRMTNDSAGAYSAWTLTAVPLAFNTAAEGSVGIGTATPVGILQLVGSVPKLRISATQNGHHDAELVFSSATHAPNDIPIWGVGMDLRQNNSVDFSIGDLQNGTSIITVSTAAAGADLVVLPQVTTGAMLCLTANHQIGHCTASSSCLTTCTCTCTAN